MGLQQLYGFCAKFDEYSQSKSQRTILVNKCVILVIAFIIASKQILSIAQIEITSKQRDNKMILNVLLPQLFFPIRIPLGNN